MLHQEGEPFIAGGSKPCIGKVCARLASMYLDRPALTVKCALADKDALRHGMCVGIVTSQREGGVGLGYLHQSLASLIAGASCS